MVIKVGIKHLKREIVVDIAGTERRFDFLTKKRAHLESAVSQLQAAIEKINRATRKRFRVT